MKSSEHIFLITTYCDVPAKVELLDRCVSHLLKLYPHLDILIYAHYPIPLDIQKKVKYYIYDSTNPVIDMNIKIMVTWNEVTYFIGYPAKAVNIVPDTGFAVLSMWQRGFEYLNLREYKYAHVIDYDINVYGNAYDKFLKESINKLDNGVELYLEDFGNGAGIHLSKAGINLKSYLNKISSNISMQDYLKDLSDGIELYFKKIISKININYFIKEFSVEHYCVQGIFKENFDGRYIWVGRNENNKIIVIINSNDDSIIESIDFQVDDSSYKVKSTNNKTYISFDITNLNPKFFKILKYNNTEINSIIVPKIDDNYLKNHFIDKM